jgi:predicted Zn-dependent protease
VKRAIIAASLLAGVALACGEINAPPTPAGYEYRLFVPATGGGVDTLAFAWPPSRLPMKIWVADTLDYPARMQAAIEAWKAQFLYGEFQAQVVSDSNTADVIVVAAPAPAEGPIVPLRLGRRARECEGATDLAIDETLTQIRLPIRIYVEPVVTASPELSTCLDVTLAHELGHAMGIYEHSPNATDLMASDPVAPAPTTNDRATAQRMFHGTVTLTVVDR